MMRVQRLRLAIAAERPDRKEIEWPNDFSCTAAGKLDSVALIFRHFRGRKRTLVLQDPSDASTSRAFCRGIGLAAQILP